MSNTLPRVRAGQPVTDDGSCWRSLAERQQSDCTRATFTASLNHTGSAHLIGESEDRHPSPEPRRVPRWRLLVVFVVFFAVGWFAGDALHAAAKLWATLP